MHNALEIPEVLANIFRHHDRRHDLSSLARTCRAFKEPALDALWENLDSGTPLVRCLPEASHQYSHFQYSFHRPLTRTEWDVLRGYARRIRSIHLSSFQLDHPCLRILSNPPTTEPLFPNLCSLHCEYNIAVLLFRYPLPFLLGVTFVKQTTSDPDTSPLDDFLEVFPRLCPKVKRAHFLGFGHCQKAVSDCIRGWQSLEDVTCGVPLDAVAIAHLSCIGCLTSLDLTANPQLSPVDSPLVFPYLHDFALGHTSWSSISLFLSWIRLPATGGLTAVAYEPLSKSELSSFLESVQMSGASHVIHKFELRHEAGHDAHGMPLEVLSLDDLRPCMAFNSLRLVTLDILWDICLADSDLLTLASAWPHLEVLRISDTWGWNTTGGITLNGLLQLLQTCPSLHEMALAVDTQDYDGRVPESLGPTLPRPFVLNVLDSTIGEDTVSPVAAFFALISLPGFVLYSLSSDYHEEVDEQDECNWMDVYKQVQHAMRERHPEVVQGPIITCSHCVRLKYSHG